MTNTDTHPGPLRIPLRPPSPKMARTVQEDLRGYATAANWLPADTGWAELDELRAEHLRVRAQVADQLAALEALTARFRDEDRQHARRLRQAQRDGTPETVQDERTPREQREAERAAIEGKAWAGLMVLAEVVQEIVELFRQREDEWLGDLRGRLGPAEEKRREAQRLLDEAVIEEWQLHRLGDWVQKISEDGPFGRAPAPTASLPPDQFSAERFRSMLHVPWHRNRPWKGEVEPPVKSWQEISEEQAEPVEPLPDGDQTGEVSELDESEAA